MRRINIVVFILVFSAVLMLSTLTYHPTPVAPLPDNHMEQTAETTTTSEPPSSETTVTVSTVIPTPVPPVEPVPDVAKVVAWGQTATSANGSATLVGKSAGPGPIEGTQQIIFDLCAAEELSLPDTGMVDLLDLIGNDPVYTGGNILIDNTNTVVLDRDGYLGRYLPAGSCATVVVVSYDEDMETAYLGFAYYQTSSGVELDGEFTRINPGGEATQLVYTS